MTIAVWLLVAVGMIAVLIGWGLMSGLTSTGLRLAEVVDRQTRHLHREMRRLHQALAREAALPVRVIGHMHLDPPSDDPEATGDLPPSDWSERQKRRERLADGPWTWVITDSAGVLLRRVPAQPIEYQELSKHEAEKRIEEAPEAYEKYYKRADKINRDMDRLAGRPTFPTRPRELLAHEETRANRQSAMRKEAERVAREVFPVCSVRAAKCGYESPDLLCDDPWAYDIAL